MSKDKDKKDITQNYNPSKPANPDLQKALDIISGTGNVPISNPLKDRNKGKAPKLDPKFKKTPTFPK